MQGRDFGESKQHQKHLAEELDRGHDAGAGKTDGTQRVGNTEGGDFNASWSVFDHRSGGDARRIPNDACATTSRIQYYYYLCILYIYMYKCRRWMVPSSSPQYVHSISNTIIQQHRRK